MELRAALIFKPNKNVYIVCIYSIYVIVNIFMYYKQLNILKHTSYLFIAMFKIVTSSRMNSLKVILILSSEI